MFERTAALRVAVLFCMPADRFHQLLTGDRTLVMGVLNVTPDSFSDGGSYLDAGAALVRAKQMIAEGADVIDVGGQSTRPRGATYGDGAKLVSEQEELARVIPVIESIRKYDEHIPISVDTVRSSVAERAVQAGASVVNDVSAGTSDGQMLETVSNLGVPIILMHGYGPEFQKLHIEDYHYNDVVGQVGAWLEHRIAEARTAGISTVLADCGFGFAKTFEDNLILLSHHNEFQSLGVPMTVGVSRKSSIGKLIGGAPPGERVSASVAAAMWAALHGAKLIRVHDVKQTMDALTVTEALTANHLPITLR